MTVQQSSLILTGDFHLTCSSGVFVQKVAISHLLHWNSFQAKFWDRESGCLLCDQRQIFRKTGIDPAQDKRFRRNCGCASGMLVSRSVSIILSWRNQNFKIGFPERPVIGFPISFRWLEWKEIRFKRTWYSESYTGLKKKQAGESRVLLFLYPFLFNFCITVFYMRFIYNESGEKQQARSAPPGSAV